MFKRNQTSVATNINIPFNLTVKDSKQTKVPPSYKIEYDSGDKVWYNTGGLRSWFIRLMIKIQWVMLLF